MRRKRQKKPREEAPETTRARILRAAIELLSEGGRDAITTRAVADAAGVQPPVLYRHFRDKEAMLDALAEHGFLAYLAEKRRGNAKADPVDVLRSGWDLHIEFGLSHPELYLLMYAQPRPGVTSSAAVLSLSMLRQHVGRIAAAGRLRVPEQRAVSLFHAAAMGVVLVLLNATVDTRDMTLSHVARDAILAVIADAPEPPSSQVPERIAAITLRAALNQSSPFSPGELSLFMEWLDRLAT